MPSYAGQRSGCWTCGGDRAQKHCPDVKGQGATSRVGEACTTPQRQCDHCGMMGHTQDRCFALHLELRREGARTGDQGRGGRDGRGRGAPQGGRVGANAHPVAANPRDVRIAQLEQQLASMATIQIRSTIGSEAFTSYATDGGLAGMGFMCGAAHIEASATVTRVVEKALEPRGATVELDP